MIIDVRSSEHYSLALAEMMIGILSVEHGQTAKNKDSKSSDSNIL